MFTDLGQRRRQPDRDPARHAARVTARPHRSHRARSPTATSRSTPTPSAGRRHHRPDDPVPRHRRPLHAHRRHGGRHALLQRDHRDHRTRRSRCATVGTNGGQAAAFTYDLRAVDRLHAPGQPGLGRPGARRPVAPIRSDDLYFGGAHRSRLGRPEQGRDPAGRRAAAAAGQPDRDDEPRPQAAAAVLVLPAQRSRPSSSPPATITATAAPPAGSTQYAGQQPGRLLGRRTGSACGSRRTSTRTRR